MQLAYTALETAALVRDISLIIFFVLGAILLIVGIVLGVKFYKRASGVVDRVDNTVGKVEAMVSTVEGAASTVKSTASNVNRGMRAGAFARSAMDSVFGIGKRSGKRDKTESDDEAEESEEPRKAE